MSSLLTITGLLYLVIVGALKVLSDSLNEQSFEKDCKKSDWNHERLAQQNDSTERLTTPHRLDYCNYTSARVEKCFRNHYQRDKFMLKSHVKLGRDMSELIQPPGCNISQ